MFIIRKAVAADIPALRILEKELIEHERKIIPAIKDGDDVYYQNIPALINDAVNTLVLVMTINGEVIGCGMGQIRKNEHYYKDECFGYIGMMSIAHNYRGNGYGPLIIEELINWLKTKNVNEVQLKAFAGNHGALKAYKKLGFENFSIDMKLEI